MTRITGTARADTLRGTLGEDRIFGLRGSDYVWGDDYEVEGLLIGSDDRIEGGRGLDTIAGDGDMTMTDAVGMWGEARLVGANDRVMGGGGIDDVTGDGMAVSDHFNASAEGGNDRVLGGNGDDTVAGDGAVMSLNAHAELVGGNDTVAGGDGDDTVVGDGDVIGYEEALLRGGDDRIVGGKGVDWLIGDGRAVCDRSSDFATITGGADTFVFREGYGQDVVQDFRREDGDLIELEGYRWRQLDSNGDGVLTDRDRRVSEDLGDIESPGTVIDLGGGDELTLILAVELVETDFLFV